MFCEYCGTELAEKANFCVNCGKPHLTVCDNRSQQENYSVAAKLFMVSGKLPGLTEGLSFYQSPSGEKVNSRVLAAYLTAATIESLSKRGALEYREAEIQAIGGKIPVLVLNRKSADGIGFEKILLEKLDTEKNLIDLTKDIIGGRYQSPESQVLWLIRREFPQTEYTRQEEVGVFLMKRKETCWIPEKVKPLIDAWLPQMTTLWDETLRLPWLKTAVRDFNFGLSSQKAIPKRDLHSR
jgi:hypothetical protein